MRAWFNGRTSPCQGLGPGSIPGVRTFFDLTLILEYYSVIAPVVKWISHRSSEPLLWVRFLPGAQCKYI